MTQKNPLGIYFSETSISFCKIDKNNLSFCRTIPLQSLPSHESKSSINMGQSSSIQKSLEDLGINNPDISLSFSVKDIFFRTFTMPLMSAEELQSAVGFEAKKYVPFSMENLIYRFHAIPFYEGKIRKLFILFLAIRKENLEKYFQILKPINGKILFAEPSCINLFRLLINHKKISLEDQSVLVQLEDLAGSITIFQNRIPHFIRDFTLDSSQESFSLEGSSATTKSLLNEIRLSFDFYKRQLPINLQKNTKRHFFIFSNHDADKIAESIAKNYNQKTTAIYPEKFIPKLPTKNVTENLHELNALSASLSPSIRLIFNSNLAEKQESPDSLNLNTFLSRPCNYAFTVKFGIVCVLILSLLFWFSYSKKIPHLNSLAKLQLLEKTYQNIPPMVLKKEIGLFEKRNAIYQNIRFHSNMAPLLYHLPETLPDGIWLDNLDIRYQNQTSLEPDSQEKTIFVLLNGYAYAEQLTVQISLIEDFMRHLKDHHLLKAQEIKLDTIKKAKFDNFSVTAFAITLEIGEGHD